MVLPPLAVALSALDTLVAQLEARIRNLETSAELTVSWSAGPWQQKPVLRKTTSIVTAWAAVTSTSLDWIEAVGLPSGAASSMAATGAAANICGKWQERAPLLPSRSRA